MTMRDHTLADFADLLGRLIKRCTMLSGEVAGRAHLTIDRDDVTMLRALKERIQRAANKEAT